MALVVKGLSLEPLYLTFQTSPWLHTQMPKNNKKINICLNSILRPDVISLNNSHWAWFMVVYCISTTVPQPSFVQYENLCAHLEIQRL